MWEIDKQVVLQVVMLVVAAWGFAAMVIFW